MRADKSPFGERRPIDIGVRLADRARTNLPSDHAIPSAAKAFDIFEAASQFVFEIGKGLAEILGRRAFRPQALE